SERRLGGAPEDGVTGTGACQNLLRRAGAPRFGGNSAECYPRMPDRAFFDPEGRGGRYYGEREGGAFADFQIPCMSREHAGLGRQPALPSISTTASSATRGTQKSDGWVAMQASLQPSTACNRFSPWRASQPAPGSRLLQALATS